MKNNLKILILEDLPSDAELAKRELKKTFDSVEFLVTSNEKDYINALKNFNPDLIISDYQMPVYNGMQALQLRNKKYPFTPFIILTGSQNEDTAVKCMKTGADDYVIKEHIKRLDQAAKNALEKKENERKRKLIEVALIESEEKYRTLVSTAAEGFWLIDAKSRTLDVNDSLCRMLGYTRNEMLSKTPFDFVDEENVKIFKKQIFDLRTIKQGSFEVVLTSKAGQTIPTIFNATSQFNSYGDRTGFFAFITDVSNLKEAEKEIENRLKEKMVLIQEIYHRTKNNMAVISALLSLEAKRSNNEFVKIKFKEIINKIRAMSLVHQKLYDVKDLSNIKLNDYIKDLMGLLMQSSYPMSKRINITFDMQEIKILIDTAVPLGMIINELVSNIFKHAFPTQKEGEIFIGLFKEFDKTINLQLRDSGVGFPNNFDPRNDASIGLSTVFSVVEKQLKGKISFENNKGLNWHIKIKDDIYKERV